MKLTKAQIRKASETFTLSDEVENATLLAIAQGEELESEYEVPAASSGTGVTQTLLGAADAELPGGADNKAKALYNNPQLLIGRREFDTRCCRTDYAPELGLLMKFAALQVLANRFAAADTEASSEVAHIGEDARQVTRVQFNEAASAARAQLDAIGRDTMGWFVTKCLATGTCFTAAAAFAVNGFTKVVGDTHVDGVDVNTPMQDFASAGASAAAGFGMLFSFKNGVRTSGCDSVFAGDFEAEVGSHYPRATV